MAIYLFIFDLQISGKNKVNQFNCTPFTGEYAYNLL